MALGVVLHKGNMRSLTVDEVELDSKAQQLGLFRGDRIAQVNDTPVYTTSDILDALRATEVESITVHRGTQTLRLTREGAEVTGVAPTMPPPPSTGGSPAKLRAAVAEGASAASSLRALGFVALIAGLIVGAFLLTQVQYLGDGGFFNPYAGVGWALMIWSVAQCWFAIAIARYIDMQVTMARYTLHKDDML